MPKKEKIEDGSNEPARGTRDGPVKGPNDAREVPARGLGEAREPNAEHAKGPRPDFRVVQTEQTPEGETRFTNVGAMWRGVSRNGNEFYTMRIGKLKLLVFPNSAQ